MNISNTVKYACMGFLGILISGYCVFWATELYIRITEKPEPMMDREIPIGASLLKTYDTYGSYKLKLWKLDGMCFISYNLETPSALLTYVPCPTQEKEKP